MKIGNVTTDYRFKIRCVSGEDVPHPIHGHLTVGRDGFARIELSGLDELMELVRWWNCPVTVSPPEGTEATNSWVVELEDGLHAPTEEFGEEDLAS